MQANRSHRHERSWWLHGLLYLALRSCAVPVFLCQATSPCRTLTSRDDLNGSGERRLPVPANGKNAPKRLQHLTQMRLVLKLLLRSFCGLHRAPMLATELHREPQSERCSPAKRDVQPAPLNPGSATQERSVYLAFGIPDSRGLTFEMRGVTRLAGARPLD